MRLFSTILNHRATRNWRTQTLQGTRSPRPTFRISPYAIVELSDRQPPRPSWIAARITTARLGLILAGCAGCGRQQVVALATKIRFDAVDLMALGAAQYLEPFAMTRIHPAIK